MTELGITEIQASIEDFYGQYLARDVIHPETGEVLASLNDEFTEEVMENMKEAGVGEVALLFIDKINVSSSMRDTLLLDKVETKEEAILDIYRKIRPSNPPDPGSGHGLFREPVFQSGSL